MDLNLSLIIPNYNNEKYLEDCLQSVLNQTYIPDEVIVADDASVDGSVSIIKTYEKEYDFIRGIYREQNLGVAKNRHQAILDAKYEYISTLDSDDFYFSRTKLEKELELIKKKSKQSESIIPYSSIVKVDKKGDKISTRIDQCNAPEGNILYSMITRSKPVPRDLIFRKEQYIEAGGFDPNFQLYEDWDFKIRLAAQHEFYFTREEGVAYRSAGESLSSASTHSHIFWRSKVIQKNLNLVPLKLKLIVLFRFCLYVSKTFFIKALKLSPKLFQGAKRMKNLLR
ncbi:glycosyltransferase [Candidatus Bipolaricaulota bacterium]|nr:glycosyltransferase [Candidatus Bipolaricaulota bacterium]